MGRKTHQKRPRKAPGRTIHIPTPPSSRYRSHYGEPHSMTLPLPELGGGRACRRCGLLETAIRRIEREGKRAKVKAEKKEVFVDEPDVPGPFLRSKEELDEIKEEQ